MRKRKLKLDKNVLVSFETFRFNIEDKRKNFPCNVGNLSNIIIKSVSCCSKLFCNQ